MEESNLVFRMYCFGGFLFVADNDRSIEFATNNDRALLVYLAVEAPKSFRRSHLAGLLWSECSEKRALHNLRQTLYQLKKAWSETGEDRELLNYDQYTISINPELDLWVDVFAFEKAYRNAIRFMRDRSQLNRLDIQLLKDAVALFNGPFLDRFLITDTSLFNEWETFQRERTNQMIVQCLDLLVDYHTRRGEFTRAGYLSDQIIALTPWDQSAYAKSMQLYAAGKLWHTASIKYNQLRTYLEVNFSESPQLSMVALNKQIIELSLKDKALPLLIQTRKDTLPKLSSSFMGRVNEVLELSGMIANPKIRLLTIIGVGGIGKTRLAIEVGSLFRGLFKDGIFFIPLKEISSLKGFFHYIGDYLQYTFSGKASPQQQLINYMRGRQCLLILDGCEKETIKFLVADFISGLLDQALDIVILGTSRKRLGLEEEHVYVLTGLNCEPVLMAQNQELPEAVALLKRRILQTDSKFEFSESNLTALNKLCSQVDGHPLSIELIASAMATRSIAEIFSMIGDNQKKIQSLLTESSTQNPVLSIVLENSWISLPDQQKDAICCLSKDFPKKPL